jgi:hypothetical protein
MPTKKLLVNKISTIEEADVYYVCEKKNLVEWIFGKKFIGSL